MLGPVRMMKGACSPPSSTSLGTKVRPTLMWSPAERCRRPFALNTCVTMFHCGQDEGCLYRVECGRTWTGGRLQPFPRLQQESERLCPCCSSA